MAIQPPQEKWMMYNDLTHKFEQIDLEDAELLPGQTVVRMYYCRSIDTFCTVPGASLYKVTADLNLELED